MTPPDSKTAGFGAAVPAAVVLVCEQRDDRGWRVSRADEHSVTSLIDADHCAGAWSDCVAESVRAAGADLVQAVVLLVKNQQGGEYPERLAYGTVPVLRMPSALALAASAPSEWQQFAVVDPISGICGLVTRLSDGHFHYLQGELETTLAIGAQLGYANSLRPSGENAYARGAAAIARSALARNGVVAAATSGRCSLRLTATRETSYEIIETREVFDPKNDALAHLAGSRAAMIVIDSGIEAMHRRAIEHYAVTRLNYAGCAVAHGGEGAKKWDQVEQICTFAANVNLPRQGVLIAVGGGVILDVVGLAAALYRRGVGYVRVPTTLVGIIDVALGIKQAVNFVGKKNLVGSFYAPVGGVVDLSFVATLRSLDVTCGLAEMIKVAMVRDAVLFELLESYALPLLRSKFQHPAGAARQLTLRAAHTMMADLQTDLFESVHARFPDFGHTFSPVMEAASSYSLPHGQAVAIDMLLTTVIAVKRGICPPAALDRLVALYDRLDLLALPGVCTPKVLMEGLAAARLHRGGTLHIVAPTGVGRGCFLEDVEFPEVVCALDATARLDRRHSTYASSCT